MMTAPQRVYLYFYTDSVGLPRLDQSSDITWPFLLKDMLERHCGTRVYLNMRGLGGGRIGEIERIFQRDTGYFKGHGALTRSFAIFNVGVVDAAPRPFTYHLKAIARIPRIGGHLWNAISVVLHANRRLLQRIHWFRLTSPRAFRASFARMIQQCQRSDLIAVSVDTPLTPHRLEARSPGLRESIALYNSLKHSIGAVMHIPMEGVGEEHYLECGHHFNVTGHELLAARLFDSVGALLHE